MTKKQEFLDKVASESLKGDDIFLLFDVMEEMSHSHEDVMDLLEDLKEEEENITLNFKVDERKGYLKIDDGILTTKRHELDPNPTLTLTMNEDTAVQILKGKLPMVKAYQEGKIKAEGSLMKVAALGILLNIAGDEIGVL